MGAAQFETVGLGKSAAEAFNAARADAQYEHGHGGYTGTIAEVHNFQMFTPKRPTEFPELVRSIDTDTSAKRGYPVGYDGRKITKADAVLALKAATDTDDKWGPCGCAEVTGQAATKIKAAYGRKGTRDRVFVFFGWASE